MLASFGMSINLVMGVSYCVCDGAWPTTFHKDRCHMVKGLSSSVSLEIFPPKITASHRMHEINADANFCLCFDLFHIGVGVVVDTVEESHPIIPAMFLLLMSRFGYPFSPGHFCASCAIQEV